MMVQVPPSTVAKDSGMSSFLGEMLHLQRNKGSGVGESRFVGGGGGC